MHSATDTETCLFSPADYREAESDSERSLPPTENGVIKGEQ